MNASIPTFTGRRFDPLSPRPQDFCIEDIAHALSQECRYAGQTSRFYSVAEHSVMVSRWAQILVQKSAVSPEFQQFPGETEHEVSLWGLLHDASEGLGLRDIPVPILRNAKWAAGYREAHQHVMSVVAEKFGLGKLEPHAVIEADKRMVATEWPQLIHPSQAYEYSSLVQSFGTELSCLDPINAEFLFLARYRSIMSSLRRQESPQQEP